MKVNPDDYLEMIKRLERDISPIDAPAFYASAAISLVTGKGDATNRAFGAYDAYRDLVEDILS